MLYFVHCIVVVVFSDSSTELPHIKDFVRNGDVSSACVGCLLDCSLSSLVVKFIIVLML
jgi:hypothetical protein